MRDELINEFDGKYVGFFVKTKREKYKPIIGMCRAMPEDADCIIISVADQVPLDFATQAVAELEKAQADCVDSDQPIYRIFREPQQTAGMMGHWLSPMLASESDWETIR